MKRICALILVLLFALASPSSAVVFFDVDGDRIRLGGGGGGGGGGTELASDAFASNGSLDAYATWVVGFDCEDPTVSSGVVQPNASLGWACALSTATTWPNDQYGQITLTNLTTDSAKAGAVTVRHQTGSSQYYICIVYGPLGTSSASWEIAKKTNASGYQVIKSATNVTINAGDVLRCEVVSDTITMKINGTTIDSGAGGSAFASGSVGLFIHSSTSVAAAQLDNWSGGSIP